VSIIDSLQEKIERMLQKTNKAKVTIEGYGDGTTVTVESLNKIPPAQLYTRFTQEQSINDLVDYIKLICEIFSDKGNLIVLYLDGKQQNKTIVHFNIIT